LAKLGRAKGSGLEIGLLFGVLLLLAVIARIMVLVFRRRGVPTPDQQGFLMGLLGPPPDLIGQMPGSQDAGDSHHEAADLYRTMPGRTTP
jgi:hypothetical protein